MMAVVEIKGKQYRVHPENHIKVDKIPVEIGEEVIFDKVLMAQKEEGELEIGTPFLEKVKVKARVLDQARDKKVLVGKFKRRKNYQRKYGHRQPFTQIKIEEILWEGEEQ